MNELEFECEQVYESIIDPKRVNKAIGYACRVLGMREYSQKSMRQKLQLKQYNSAEIDQTIEFLLENNWLSDQRFCDVFVRSKVNKGQGQARIQYELSQKGISQLMIEQAILEQDIDWQVVCDDVAKRKVDSASIKNNIKDRQKIERFLRYRGFSGEQIRKSMNKYIN